MRAQVLGKGERVDGRDTDTIRPISIDTGLLPRAHGSALFQRGETQALVAVTLGTADDEQRVDSIDTQGETTKSFMLHYNFPPFSTGEVEDDPRHQPPRDRPRRTWPSARCSPLLPAYESFPYTIRVVSEILESNGSSSMASVCGGSLALMDAGVPIKAPCAGVAMGLVDGRRQGRHPHRHPRQRGRARRHGLQGGRHGAGHHRRSRWTSRSRASRSS